MNEVSDLYGINEISNITCWTMIGINDKREASHGNAWDAFLGINSWYKEFLSQSGKTEMFYEIEISFDGHKADSVSKVTSGYYSYPEFVGWIRDFLRKKSILCTVPLKRQAEIHVDWHKVIPEVASRRRCISPEQPFRIKRHKMTSSRFQTNSYKDLVNLICGYDWTIDFEGITGVHHYYQGHVEYIHRDLMRIAGGLQLSAVPLIDQQDAITGLQKFYEKYPLFIDKLSSFDVSGLVSLTLPGNSLKIQAEATKLVGILPYRIARDPILSSIRQVERWLDSMRIHDDETFKDSNGIERSNFNNREIVRIKMDNGA